MANQSLLLTLVTGTLASMLLFFLFNRAFRVTGKLSALLSILVVQVIYLPLAILYWPGLDVFAIHFAFFTMMAYGLGIISSHRDEQRRLDEKLGREPEQKAGWHWGPVTIIVFFIFLAGVDATIITIANKGVDSDLMTRFLPEPKSGRQVASSFPGAVSHDFQEKYDQFNNYLKQLKSQGQRGWRIEGGWLDKPFFGKSNTFQIQVLDREGKGLNNAQVSMKLMRSSDQRLDHKVVLQAQGDGLYQADLDLPQPGYWLLVLHIEREGERHEVQGDTWLNDKR